MAVPAANARLCSLICRYGLQYRDFIMTNAGIGTTVTISLSLSRVSKAFASWADALKSLPW